MFVHVTSLSITIWLNLSSFKPSYCHPSYLTPCPRVMHVVIGSHVSHSAWLLLCYETARDRHDIVMSVASGTRSRQYELCLRGIQCINTGLHLVACSSTKHVFQLHLTWFLYDTKIHIVTANSEGKTAKLSNEISNNEDELQVVDCGLFLFSLLWF